MLALLLGIPTAKSNIFDITGQMSYVIHTPHCENDTTASLCPGFSISPGYKRKLSERDYVGLSLNFINYIYLRPYLSNRTNYRGVFLAGEYTQKTHPNVVYLLTLNIVYLLRRDLSESCFFNAQTEIGPAFYHQRDYYEGDHIRSITGYGYNASPSLFLESKIHGKLNLLYGLKYSFIYVKKDKIEVFGDSGPDFFLLDIYNFTIHKFGLMLGVRF